MRHFTSPHRRSSNRKPWMLLGFKTVEAIIQLKRTCALQPTGNNVHKYLSLPNRIITTPISIHNFPQTRQRLELPKTEEITQSAISKSASIADLSLCLSSLLKFSQCQMSKWWSSWRMWGRPARISFARTAARGKRKGCWKCLCEFKGWGIIGRNFKQESIFVKM